MKPQAASPKLQRIVPWNLAVLKVLSKQNPDFYIAWKKTTCDLGLAACETLSMNEIF